MKAGTKTLFGIIFVLAGLIIWDDISSKQDKAHNKNLLVK